jgi:hypothetical protein
MNEDSLTRHSDATLIVERCPGIMDQARTYAVIVDGLKIGLLAPRERQSFSISAGDHIVHIALDFARSRKLHFHVGPGDEYRLRCRSAPFAPLRSIVSPHNYIELSPGTALFLPQRSLAMEAVLRFSIVGGSLVFLLLMVLPITLAVGIRSDAVVVGMAVFFGVVALLAFLVPLPFVGHKSGDGVDDHKTSSGSQPMA